MSPKRSKIRNYDSIRNCLRKDSFDLVDPGHFAGKDDSRHSGFEANTKNESLPFSTHCTWLMNRKECYGNYFKFQRTDRKSYYIVSELSLYQQNCDVCGITERTGTNFCDISESKVIVSPSANFETCEFQDVEILCCLPNLFVSECSSDGEKADCQCNEPCEVPTSPSVVDVTGERIALDEGEIFSSGDELDKIESDTDSQDTVIEGEAYKRMRNVAIKEKIFHANEELFGSSCQQTCARDLLASKATTYRSKEKILLPFIGEVQQVSRLPLLESEANNDFPVLPISLDAEESDPCPVYSSLERQMLDAISANDSLQLPLVSEAVENVTNSSQVPFADSVCSSESSDNGSDGEEVVLSDTSTSSDEATYIVPARGSQLYNYSAPYKLHTIVEESCDESDVCLKSFRSRDYALEDLCKSNSHPGNKASFYKTSDNNYLKLPANLNQGVGDSVCTISITSCQEFSKPNLQNDFGFTIPDDDMTDESGGVSSDEDTSSIKVRKRTANDQNMKRKSRKQIQTSPFGNKDHSSRKCNRIDGSDSPQTKVNSVLGDSRSEKGEQPGMEIPEHMSDDDAKYIMSHLMLHISNENSHDFESPLIKELESEIVRLMLTVSPASLSAGEPSSSCSSTIGSNNSDYGSDTLESAEESVSNEEENTKSQNQVLIDDSPLEDLEALKNEACSSNYENSENVAMASGPTVSEETLYICKQLMASLKKITDVSEMELLPCSSGENNSAKQYITDQIVSLMQTVNASQTSSPLFHSNDSPPLLIDSDVSQDPSDSDSPPNGAGHHQSQTPSESGSTISASISIPSYDDSDRTPTESEISHEMDELYALLERSCTPQDVVPSKMDLNIDYSHKNEHFKNEGMDFDSEFKTFPSNEDYHYTQSFLCEGSSELESILPISFEERIARYKDAFLVPESESDEPKLLSTETLINVELPYISILENSNTNRHISNSLPLNLNSISKNELDKMFSVAKSFDNILSSQKIKQNISSRPSDQGISNNTYPPSCAHFKKLPHPVSFENTPVEEMNALENESSEENTLPSNSDASEMLSSSNIRNAKEKASSENDLLVANYRSKSKSSKVFGTKSAGNICDLENINIKNTFRDTGYYSFKSSGDSFLSLDDSTASQTSTASLTLHRSLTSTETIPEEEEPSVKGPVATKMSLSSGNIPDAVCDTSASKSSTLPLSLRSKQSGPNHRPRSSFFTTSGVLRKLTLLRDESGNSLRSSPHGSRMRMRNRSLSGGSEDGRQRKLPASDSFEKHIIRSDTCAFQDEEPILFQSRSHMSLSSFGGRSESITSVYSAAGGGRYGTVTVTGDVLFGSNYNLKTLVLEITVKECRNLAPVDTKRNRSDPYVKVYLLPDRTKSGKRKTKVKKHTLNPGFDELLRFQVPFNELETRTLWLSVWHSDRFGRNDFLGEVMLSLGNEILKNSGLKWYPLQEKLDPFESPASYKGDLILALRYTSPEANSPKASKSSGALEVLVRQARNLMATRSNGTSDPFCKSYLLPDKSKGGKQKTPVLKKSCHPNWNHTFKYEGLSHSDLRERCLELTVWDYDKITSNDFLGGVRLCLGTGKYQGKDVDWMDSAGEEQSLWYTLLERPNTWVEGSLLLRPSMQSRRTL